MISSAPANRAVRLQLRSRLDLAAHAAELLDNKEEALRRERIRLEGHLSRTQTEWHQRLATAATWLLRARALGAGAELATLDPPPDAATIDVAWQTAMGVTYPGAVDTTPAPVPELTTTAALAPTTSAYRAALDAAAQHAAATAALRRVDDELVNTRRRRRALEQHLEPRLRAEIHRLDLILDERDRDTALRTQLATRHQEDAR